jgi:hypothetical protein
MQQERDDYADPPVSRRQRRLMWATVVFLVVVCYFVAEWVIDHFNLLPPP